MILKRELKLKCSLSSHLCDVFFFNQKKSYDVRISDWSSAVCSSDLVAAHLHATLEGDLQDLFGDGAAPAGDHPRPRLTGNRRVGALGRDRFWSHVLQGDGELAVRPRLLSHLASTMAQPIDAQSPGVHSTTAASGQHRDGDRSCLTIG